MELDLNKLTEREREKLKQLLGKASGENNIVKQEKRVPFANRYDIIYKGKKLPLVKWCEELNLSYKLMYRRIVDLGWTVERAFETPARVSQPKENKRAEHKIIECPVCHQKFRQANSNQKICPNEHCKRIATAKAYRDKLYKIRMAELGKSVDELVQ